MGHGPLTEDWAAGLLVEREIKSVQFTQQPILVQIGPEGDQVTRLRVFVFGAQMLGRVFTRRYNASHCHSSGSAAQSQGSIAMGRWSSLRSSGAQAACVPQSVFVPGTSLTGRLVEMDSGESAPDQPRALSEQAYRYSFPSR